jgi:hypothetical protein
MVTLYTTRETALGATTRPPEIRGSKSTIKRSSPHKSTKPSITTSQAEEIRKSEAPALIHPDLNSPQPIAPFANPTKLRNPPKPNSPMAARQPNQSIPNLPGESILLESIPSYHSVSTPDTIKTKFCGPEAGSQVSSGDETTVHTSTARNADAPRSSKTLRAAAAAGRDQNCEQSSMTRVRRHGCRWPRAAARDYSEM